jgi:hypothetical protein
VSFSQTPITTPIRNGSPLLDGGINEATTGLAASFAKQLHSIIEDNAEIIVKYIATMKSEVNLSDHYRRDLIAVLCKFSKSNNNEPFKDLTRTDILRFLDSFRRTETQDPMHKWIGTYNIYRMHLLRFFKWLYYPDIEPDRRSKPHVIENIPRLRRKETLIYNVTASNTTYFKLNHICANSIRSILMDLEVLDLTNMSEVETWLDLVEDKFESFRVAYLQLTGDDVAVKDYLLTSPFERITWPGWHPATDPVSVARITSTEFTGGPPYRSERPESLRTLGEFESPSIKKSPTEYRSVKLQSDED